MEFATTRIRNNDAKFREILLTSGEFGNPQEEAKYGASDVSEGEVRFRNDWPVLSGNYRKHLRACCACPWYQFIVGSFRWSAAMPSSQACRNRDIPYKAMPECDRMGRNSVTTNGWKYPVS